MEENDVSTNNWTGKLTSVLYNLLCKCKLVSWLCYLIKGSHAHCYLIFSCMKDGYKDFGLAGYWIFAPMDPWIKMKWSSGPPLEIRFVSRNRIWRRDFWWTISSNSGPLISRLHRRHGEPTHPSKNAILSVRLNSSLKILTWLNRRNRTLIAFHYIGWNSKQWYQVLSVSSEEEKKPVQRDKDRHTAITRGSHSLNNLLT